MSREIQIRNFYEIIDPKYLTSEVKYPNQDLVNMIIPLRCLIIGASGSGKTNILMNIITAINVFQKIYLFCPNHNQSLYNFLKDYYTDVEKKLKMKPGSILTIIETYDQLPNIDTDIDTSKNNLIIFDDVLAEGPAGIRAMQNIFTRGRTKNISAIMLSQSYFSVNTVIRRNADYLIMKRLNQITDLARIVREYSMGIGAKQLINLYYYATKKKLDFFMIDMVTTDEKYKFRINFNPFNQ